MTRRVQALVEVALGHRDVVVELARDRPPERVDDAQCRVAVLELVDQDAQGVDVVDLVEVGALALHLLPDAVDVLRSAGELGLDAGGLQGVGEDALDLLDVGLAGLAPCLELAGQAPVGLAFELLEGEVLELPLDLPDAQALGERGVDLRRLASDALALLARQVRQRAHVVQPVGQLDEDDPDVLGHGQEHLPDVLRLLLLVGVGGEARQLRHPIHEPGHVGAEALLDVGQREVRVLGHVVEQGGRGCDRVDAQVGQDLGRGDGMRDVRLAGGALLPGVGLGREAIGALDRLQIRLGIVLSEGLDQLARLGVDDPWRDVHGGRRRPLGAGRGGRCGGLGGHRTAKCSAGLRPRPGPRWPRSPGADGDEVGLSSRGAARGRPAGGTRAGPRPGRRCRGGERDDRRTCA